jgi:hypothetical protein
VTPPAARRQHVSARPDEGTGQQVTANTLEDRNATHFSGDSPGMYRRSNTMETINVRIEALDRSVRVSLSNGGNEKDEEIVGRAEAFFAFLNKD